MLNLFRSRKCVSDDVFSDLNKLSKCIDYVSKNPKDLYMMIRRAVLHASRTNNILSLMNTIGMSISKSPEVTMDSVVKLLNELPRTYRDILLRAIELLVEKRKIIDFIVRNNYDVPKEVLEKLMDSLECIDIVVLGDLISKLPAISKGTLQAYISRALKEPLCHEGKERALSLLSQGISSGIITNEELKKIFTENSLKFMIIKRSGLVKEIRVILNGEQLSNIDSEVSLNLLKAMISSGIVKV
ncbi:MAG: hypothetical protein J7L12_05380 [Desulfurococcales archaeon]|nr:hypothetical protein [Desulfurococcales archaeon]